MLNTRYLIHRTTTLAAMLASASLFAETPASTSSTSTPPVVGTVNATAGGLAEEAPTGDFGQPEWVQHRRFATSRVHLQRNAYEWGVEQWMRVREKDGETKFLFQEEVEVGLPGRIQLDFYWDWTLEDDSAKHLDYAAEIRHAFADWGVIPLNPALYLEYKWTDASRGGDVIEPKLLLGDELGNGWHWAMNFVYERELTGEKAEEIAITQAISKTIIDEKLSIGVEMAWKHETVDGARNAPEKKFIIGPSLQWRPTKNTHLDLVGLFGCTKDSPDFEGWLVFGLDFGSSEKKVHAPVSGRR